MRPVQSCNYRRNTGMPKQTKFQKGQSGNPSGKPKGARHKTTIAAQALLEGEAEALTRKAIEKAKEGDMVALRLCLERIVPPRKSRNVSIALPKVETAEDVRKAVTAAIEAAADGMLTLDEASMLCSLLDTQRKAIETEEHENRIAALEAVKR